MRKHLYLRLAVTNIKKNRGTYIPYILTCTMCIAMLYMMLFISNNDGLWNMPNVQDIRFILGMGIAVLAIFATIFLLYSNSFVMKRRQKELGLYNILGLEKGHIARMMFAETVLTSLISLAAGIALGILGSKLALLLLLKLIHIPAQFGFYISVKGIVVCAAAFGAIFFLTLLANLKRVHFSHPVELLMGSNVGEREPEAKWFLAVLGFIAVGGGYYIAITTTSPLEALLLFFLAVFLVMVGTYLLFTAGSIAILKMMRWKKSFYYKLQNFTSISGMLYRMKQNAVGLASICILSTGVLLMLSTTVCLNVGIQDAVDGAYPTDISVAIRAETLEEGRTLLKKTADSVKKDGYPVLGLWQDVYLQVAGKYEDGGFVFRQPKYAMDTDYDLLFVMPIEDYPEMKEQYGTLADGQVLIYGQGSEGSTYKVMDQSFQVTETLSEFPYAGNVDSIFERKYTALFVNDYDYAIIDSLQKEAYQDSVSSIVVAELSLDLDADKEEKISWGHRLSDTVQDYLYEEGAAFSEGTWAATDIREEQYQSFYTLYGGFLFLGMYLGILFLMGTAMIIYYKQMSEGYEDRGRFEIMRKVGMSKKEVRSSIKRQILMIFFLPLIVAVIHIAAAFPLVKRLMAMLYLDNAKLFLLCTIGTSLIFALVYGLIYALTARSYYRILEGNRA